MNIDSYSFGKMVVDGEEYTSDLIIYPDKINDSWWRGKGHLLQKDDLEEILEAKPSVLIIGTGNVGIMRVPDKLRKELIALGIELVVERTGKAVEVFNTFTEKKGVIAAFHLTC